MLIKGKNFNIVAIIGARSGSKSIKDKNIKPLLGKPLMAWVIEAAKRAKYLDRVIVSTDSPKYAEIARKYGAETPFLRPKEISGDTATDLEYLTHAVNWLQTHDNWKPDIIFRVMPTSPLTKAEYFDRAVEILVENPEIDSVRVISLALEHPYKMWRIENEKLKSFLPKEFTGFDEPMNLPRQLFPKAYRHGGIISIRYNTLMKLHSLNGKKIGYFEIPPEENVDIHSELDFLLAEILLKKRENL